MIPPVVPGQTEEKQNMVGWKNTFNMRQISLMNLASSQIGVKNGTKSMIPNYRRAYSITSPGKSLDLLRKNLQNAINKDIDNVIKKYIEKFFQPAMSNIKNNLGKDSVGEDHIKEVCKQMLEEAKLMYSTTPNSRDSSPYEYSQSEAESETSISDGRLGRSKNLLSLRLHSLQSDRVRDYKRFIFNSEGRKPLTKKLPTRAFAKLFITKNQHLEEFLRHILDPNLSPFTHNKRKESDTESENTTTVNLLPMVKRQRNKSHNSADYSSCKLSLKRDGPKWNPDRVRGSTLFIMGARANKVLGYGQTRGRLYVRHPNLVRYSGDQEDKEWLASKNLMPPSGGKAYLMLLEDIKELTESDEYKYSPNLQLHELKGFEVPMFLLLKIKNFIEYVRTERKLLAHVDIYEDQSHSSTPPSNVALDSAPSTPSDTTVSVENPIDSSFKQEHFLNITSDISSSLSSSLISSILANHLSTINSTDSCPDF